MVHLASVPNDSDINQPLVKGLDKVKLDCGDEDEQTVSVYGSKFAGEELPKHEMPVSRVRSTCIHLQLRKAARNERCQKKWLIV